MHPLRRAVSWTPAYIATRLGLVIGGILQSCLGPELGLHCYKLQLTPKSKMHARTSVLLVSSQSGISGRLRRNIHEHVFTNCHLESQRYCLVALSPLLQAGENERVQQTSKNRDAEVVPLYCSQLKPLPHEKRSNEFINVMIYSPFSD